MLAWSGLDFGVVARFLRSGPLAQSVEQRTFNPWVVGSIPTGPTFQKRDIVIHMPKWTDWYRARFEVSDYPYPRLQLEG